MPDNNSLEKRFYSDSEERYRLLIRKIRTAIVLHDGQGRILDSNPLAEELLGLSADQLLGKELIDPEWHFLREDGSVLPIAEYPASLALSTRQPLRDYVTGISRPDRDAVTWVLVNAEPECADDGEITQVIVSFVDITERKQAEDALYEAQQEFRALIVNSPDIIARYDRDCRRTYVNPKYLKVAEISEQELLASSPAERSPLPAASAEVLQKLLRRVLESGVAEAVDVIWPKSDNIDYWYNIYAFPEFDREGRVVSVMTVSRDITARKRDEEELARMNERFALGTRAARLGIWDWDIQRNKLSWDDSMYRLYGIQREDFGGAYDAWARTIHPQDKTQTEGEIQAALRGEREYGPEFRIVRPDGTIRYIKAESQTFRDEDGKPQRMIGTNVDITERKQAEEALSRLNEELEQRVRERTKELEQRNRELEQMNKAFVGRELRMVELKERIQTLENLIGELQK